MLEEHERLSLSVGGRFTLKMRNLKYIIESILVDKITDDEFGVSYISTKELVSEVMDTINQFISKRNTKVRNCPDPFCSDLSALQSIRGAARKPKYS